MNFVDISKGWTHLQEAPWTCHQWTRNLSLGSFLKDAIPQYCNLRNKPLKHMDPWMTPEPYPNHSIKEVMRQEICKAVWMWTRAKAINIWGLVSESKPACQGTNRDCKDQLRVAKSSEWESPGSVGLMEEDFLGQGLMFTEFPVPAKLWTRHPRDSSNRILLYLSEGSDVPAIRQGSFESAPSVGNPRVQQASLWAKKS